MALQIVPILIDEPGSDGWSHCMSADLCMLHEFCNRLGYGRHWFTNNRKIGSQAVKGKKFKPYRPHYDIRAKDVPVFVANGATLITSRELIEFYQKYYDPH